MRLRCAACGCYVQVIPCAHSDDPISCFDVDCDLVTVKPCKRCLHKAKLAGLEIFSKRNCV